MGIADFLSKLLNAILHLLPWHWNKSNSINDTNNDSDIESSSSSSSPNTSPNTDRGYENNQSNLDESLPSYPLSTTDAEEQTGLRLRSSGNKFSGKESSPTSLSETSLSKALIKQYSPKSAAQILDSHAKSSASASTSMSAHGKITTPTISQFLKQVNTPKPEATSVTAPILDFNNLDSHAKSSASASTSMSAHDKITTPNISQFLKQANTPKTSTPKTSIQPRVTSVTPPPLNFDITEEPQAEVLLEKTNANSLQQAVITENEALDTQASLEVEISHTAITVEKAKTGSVEQPATTENEALNTQANLEVEALHAAVTLEGNVTSDKQEKGSQRLKALNSTLQNPETNSPKATSNHQEASMQTGNEHTSPRESSISSNLVNAPEEPVLKSEGVSQKEKSEKLLSTSQVEIRKEETQAQESSTAEDLKFLIPQLKNAISRKNEPNTIGIINKIIPTLQENSAATLEDWIEQAARVYRVKQKNIFFKIASLLKKEDINPLLQVQAEIVEYFVKLHKEDLRKSANEVILVNKTDNVSLNPLEKFITSGLPEAAEALFNSNALSEKTLYSGLERALQHSTKNTDEPQKSLIELSRKIIEFLPQKLHYKCLMLTLNVYKFPTLASGLLSETPNIPNTLESTFIALRNIVKPFSTEPLKLKKSLRTLEFILNNDKAKSYIKSLIENQDYNKTIRYLKKIHSSLVEKNYKSLWEQSLIDDEIKTYIDNLPLDATESIAGSIISRPASIAPSASEIGDSLEDFDLSQDEIRPMGEGATPSNDTLD